MWFCVIWVSPDPNRSRQGLDHAIKAFEIDNSQGPMQLLVHDVARRHRHLRTPATAYIKQFLDDFIKNKDTYAKQGGYVRKLIAAIVAANHLAGQSTEYRKKYGALAGKSGEYAIEHTLIGKRSRW